MNAVATPPIVRWRRRLHGSSAGFTLIELIVAMIITAILLAVCFPLVRNLLDASNRGVADGQARGNSIVVQQQLTSDLRGILANRATGSRDDPTLDNVASELAKNVVTSHDITFAGPRYMQFYADVVGDGTAADVSPGPERVTWMLLTDQDACGAVRPNWCVLRDVDYGPGLGQLLREVVTAGAKAPIPPDTDCWPGKPGPDARLFCFKYDAPANGSYLWGSWSSSCASNWTNPAGQAWNTLGSGAAPPARPGIVTSDPNLRGTYWNSGAITSYHENPASGIRPLQLFSLDRVRTVGIVALGGSFVSGDGNADSRSAAVDLRGRASDEYSRAIECGVR